MTIEEKMSREKKGVLMLSVIMITIPERKREFAALHKKLVKQIFYCSEIHPTLGNVEIIKVETPRFPEGPTIGEKRQMGLDKALGEFVIWLDDDDDISPDYVETLLRLAYDTPDVITFSNLSRFDSYWCVIRMSLKHEYDEQVRPGIINRRPYHVCGWRRRIAQTVKFPPLNKDEDTTYIAELLPKCKVEQHSENILHEYNRTKQSYALKALRS